MEVVSNLQSKEFVDSPLQKKVSPLQLLRGGEIYKHCTAYVII